MQSCDLQPLVMQPLGKQILGRQLFGRQQLDMQLLLARSYDSLNTKVRLSVHKGLFWRLVKSSPGEPLSWPEA